MGKRTVAVTICMLLVALGLFGSIPLFDLSVQQAVVATNALAASGNGAFVTSTPLGKVVAYQGNDGRIHVAREEAPGRWEPAPLLAVQGGYVQGIVSHGNRVTVGYSANGQIFTITSNDAGKSFFPPVAVTQSRQAASIQDMVTDSNGTIHMVFHRHDSYWDYNYAKSVDGGYYHVRNGFTAYTDSSSTGYSGNLRAAHGNLYTVYQDNNDGFAVKLSVSKDNGSSWNTTRIAPSSGGRLGLAVDPQDPDLLYIASYNKDGLTILRVREATSGTPEFLPVYGDATLIPTDSSVVTVHIATAGDGTVAALYLNPITGSYTSLSSSDSGETWEKSILLTLVEPKNFQWVADLESFGNDFFFVRTDGKGSVLLHGAEGREAALVASTGRDMGVYTPDSNGMVEIPTVENPFGIVLGSSMLMAMFEVPEAGQYRITHRTQASIPLYYSLHDPFNKGDLTLAENYDGETLHDAIELHLEPNIVYLLVLGVLDDGMVGRTVELVIESLEKKPVAVPGIPAAAVEAGIQPPKSSQPEVRTDKVRAGYFASFALSRSGFLAGAGLNQFGQMADGSTNTKKTFSPLRSAVADIAAGFGHVLYIADTGILYGAGKNEDFQLADGTQTNSLALTRIADNVISVAAGYGHSLYVQRDGSVWAVGLNDMGQLGDGSKTTRSVPVMIAKHGAQVFSSLVKTSFLLDNEGNLYGFGDNSYGQLGLGHKNNVVEPTFLTDKVKTVAPGRNHTVILKQDGSVWTSGENGHGQLGTGNTTSSTYWVAVASNISDIAAGYYNSWILSGTGDLKVAGSNRYGQYGIGTTTNTSTSVGFVSVLDDVADVAAGRDHTVVLKKDGSIWTSGLNEQSQLGDTAQGFRMAWKQVFKF
jgi:alpha-tubulin suppressor-like RCC1 family protein